MIAIAELTDASSEAAKLESARPRSVIPQPELLKLDELALAFLDAAEPDERRSQNVSRLCVRRFQFHRPPRGLGGFDRLSLREVKLRARLRGRRRFRDRSSTRRQIRRALPRCGSFAHLLCRLT